VRRLDGKRAIVTGAGTELGRAIALRTAGEAARLGGRRGEESAREIASKVEGGSLVHRVDVTREEEVEALVRHATDELGGLNATINDAGVGVATITSETSEERHDRVTEACVRGEPSSA
jgi:NAD(P)-dependent dehydrogenase (short-subunit alcohol dehydrogenase family)